MTRSLPAPVPPGFLVRELRELTLWVKREQSMGPFIALGYAGKSLSTKGINLKGK